MKPARLIAIPVLVLICGQAAGDVTFTTVALTGQQAPGLPAGVTFRFLSDARVNSAGQVAFWAELGGTGITAVNDGSIWIRSGGGLGLVLQEGDAVPGVGDTVFAAFPRPGLNDAGGMAYPGVLVPSDQTSVPINIGNFWHGAGGPQMLAREGEQAAGLPAGTNYAGFAAVSLTPGSELVWQGNAGQAAWRASESSAAAAIARRGDPAPGAGGANFDYVDLPGTAAAGVPVFRSTTLVGTTRGMGLWTSASGAPGLIALAGQQAPGAPAGVVLDHLSMGPVACASDCIAFWSRLSGAGVTAENDGAIFTGSAASPTMLVREGDAAPGTSALFGTISPQVTITPSGTIAFAATFMGAGVTSENNSGVYVATGSSVQLAAREGDAAPGLAAGVEFAGFGSPALNAAGEMVFLAQLRNGGVTPTSNRALYLRATDGTLTPLVQTGQLFETGSGQRLVEEIVVDDDPAAAGHGAFATTSGGGLLVFKLHFKDPGPNNTVIRSSGIFTAGTGPTCYANCDGSTVAPILNVADFGCFLSKFAAGDGYANCDGSTTEPILNVADFGCFLSKFAAGCPR